jgi:protease II
VKLELRHCFLIFFAALRWPAGQDSHLARHLCALQLRSLCPYQNIHPAAYPATLVTCSQTDSRVPFWGPLKYTAKLRAAQLGKGPVLLLPDSHDGHFAHESDRLRLKALHYAFLLKALGQED